MNKNYYDFLNNKVKSMDEDINKAKKIILEIKNENEKLKFRKDKTQINLNEKLHTMNDILNFYKKQGLRLVIAKKESQLESWCSVKFQDGENNRINIIDDEGRIQGVIVGEKTQKLRLLLKKLPNYALSICKVSDETFEILVRFL